MEGLTEKEAEDKSMKGMGKMKREVGSADKGGGSASTWRRSKMMERWCGRASLEGRKTPEEGIGMEDEWIDGVQREQHGGRCNLVTERGRNASPCDIFNPWCFCN